MTTKTRWYKFWIKSNRGTNSVAYKQLPHRLSKGEVKNYLEEWCAKFGAWHVSENYIEFGWEKVRKPPKNKERT